MLHLLVDSACWDTETSIYVFKVVVIIIFRIFALLVPYFTFTGRSGKEQI